MSLVAARYDREQVALARWWRAQPVGTTMTLQQVSDALGPLYGTTFGRNPRSLAKRLSNLAAAGVITRLPDPERPCHTLWRRS